MVNIGNSEFEKIFFISQNGSFQCFNYGHCNGRKNNRTNLILPKFILKFTAIMITLQHCLLQDLPVNIFHYDNIHNLLIFYQENNDNEYDQVYNFFKEG